MWCRVILFGKDKKEDMVGNPFFEAKYVGGHKLYPKSRNVEITLLQDKINVTQISIEIPYSAISNVENADDKKIELSRVILLGIAGALWKKKRTYTVIEYTDELGNQQTVVFDFDKRIEEAQQIIYKKTLEHKK